MAKRQHPGLRHSVEQANLLLSGQVHHFLVRPVVVACVYINKEWCNNAAVVSKHCSSLVEFMFVKCRPFYLQQEFTAIVIVAVYIPPCANAKDVLRELYSAISEQQTNNPNGFFIIALPTCELCNKGKQHTGTLFIQQRKTNTKLYPAPISGTQTTSLLCCYSQTCQTGSKADHSMARRCYLSTTGLLPGHRLEHV